MPNPKALSVLVLLAVAVACFYLERQIEQSAIDTEILERRDEALHDVQDLRVKMSAQISESVHILSGLRAFIEANPELQEDDFLRYAESVKRLKPSIRNIAAAPDMIIRYVFPLKGNEATIGLNYRTAPVEQRAAAFRALREGLPIIAGPVDLVQGGVGLIVRLPVYVKPSDGVMREWGILAAVIDMDKFYQRSGIRDFQNKYDLALKGKDGLGEKGAVFFGEEALFSDGKQSVMLPMDLVNGSWILAAKPIEGWPTHSENLWIVRVSFIGLFLIFAITLLTVTGYMTERALARRRQIRAIREKSEFLEILSHEIRSPLQGVLGAQKFLLDHDIDPAFRSIVQTAHQSGEYINSLINDYLDLQRAESGGLLASRAPADIREIIETSFRIVTTGKKSSSLAINFSIAEDIPAQLILDEKKVRQVLVNIIGNALKYTSHGFVSVIAKYVAVDSQPVLILKVEDTGIGIEKKDLGTLFDRFTRSERGEARNGSGLGLAIAKSLVETMAGCIDVESEVGKGTAFVISLPADPVSQKAETTTVDKRENTAPIRRGADILKGIRVLVADDVVVNRILINAMLSPLVKDVIAVENGYEVLTELEKSNFDIIIMDVNMPGMGGVEATKQIRLQPKFQDIPIIGLTAEEADDCKANLVKSGMNGVLIKPINLEPLLTVIHEHIRLDQEPAS